MINVITILTPAALATGILLKISKKERKLYQVVIAYLILLMCITFINLLVFNFLYDKTSQVLDNLTTIECIRYMLFGIVEANILPFIYEITSQHIQLNISVKGSN